MKKILIVLALVLLVQSMIVSADIHEKTLCPDSDGRNIKDTLSKGITKIYKFDGTNYEITANHIDSNSSQFVINGRVTRKLKPGEADILYDSKMIAVSRISLQNDGLYLATFYLGTKKIENGACINENKDSNCFDSDGGKDYYKKGSTKSYTQQGTLYTNTDSCCIYTENPDGGSSCKPANKADYLAERYCAFSNDGTGLGKEYAYPEIYRCPGGCEDGVCIKVLETHRLENYPNMFIKGGNFNGIVVVGDKASSEQITAAQEIASSLNAGAVRSASEVSSLDQNIISVGSHCANIITQKIENSPIDCNFDLAPGKGIIKIYTRNGYANLVVKGYADVDTRRVARIISHYKSYDLIGTEYVSKLDDTPSCSDSDGGKDNYIKGRVTGIRYENDPVISTFYDGCHKNSDYFIQVLECDSPECYVNEFYCENRNGRSMVNEKMTICSNGCKDGACIKDDWKNDREMGAGKAPRNKCLWYTNSEGCKFQQCYDSLGDLAGGGAGCKVDYSNNCDQYTDEDGCIIKECYNDRNVRPQILSYRRYCDRAEFKPIDRDLPIPSIAKYIVVVGKKAPSSDVVAIANFAATMKANYGINFVGMIHNELLDKLDNLDLERTLIVGVQGSGYSIMRGSDDFQGVVRNVENYFLGKEFHRIRLIGPYPDVVERWIAKWLITGKYPSYGIVYDEAGYIIHVAEQEDDETEYDIDDKVNEDNSVAEICTNGCKSDGKCLPIGQRVKNGKASYCDVSGEMLGQKEDGLECQNNYECSTNSCQSGACIDLAREIRENRNLLEKIAGWLGNIFGFSSE